MTSQERAKKCYDELWANNGTHSVEFVIAGIARAIRLAQLDYVADFTLFHPRAMKLLANKKPFIVIAIDEPYFVDAYNLIRNNEKAKGTWTDKDEKQYQELCVSSI